MAPCCFRCRRLIHRSLSGDDDAIVVAATSWVPAIAPRVDPTEALRAHQRAVFPLTVAPWA